MENTSQSEANKDSGFSFLAVLGLIILSVFAGYMLGKASAPQDSGLTACISAAQFSQQGWINCEQSRLEDLQVIMNLNNRTLSPEIVANITAVQNAYGNLLDGNFSDVTGK